MEICKTFSSKLHDDRRIFDFSNHKSYLFFGSFCKFFEFKVFEFKIQVYIHPSLHCIFSIFVLKFLKWLEFHKIYYVNSASFIQQYVIAGYTAYPIIFAFFAIYFKSLTSKYAKIIFCIIFFKKPSKLQNMTDAK